MLGQKIRTPINGYYTKGHHSVTWNGLDDNGLSAAAGIYIYRLKQGRYVESRKMLLIDGGSVMYSGGASRVLPQGTITDGAEALLSNATSNYAKYTGNATYQVSIYGDRGVETSIEEDIFPAYWNGNCWMKVNGVPDIESKSITVETDRLGLWTVFYGRLIGDITVGQSFDLMEDNAENANFVVLDVRTPGEYESVYLQDAVNIDYRSESFRDEVGKLDKSKKYLVYCLAGTRSSGAVSIRSAYDRNRIR